MATKAVSSTVTSKAPNWVTFIGLFLVFIGVFFSARTALNLATSSTYPIIPSTGLSTLGGGPLATYDEETCQGQEACIKSIKDSRSQAMMADITNSAFFLFLGGAILWSRKKFYQ